LLADQISALFRCLSKLAEAQLFSLVDLRLFFEIPLLRFFLLLRRFYQFGKFIHSVALITVKPGFLLNFTHQISQTGQRMVYRKHSFQSVFNFFAFNDLKLDQLPYHAKLPGSQTFLLQILRDLISVERQIIFNLCIRNILAVKIADKFFSGLGRNRLDLPGQTLNILTGFGQHAVRRTQLLVHIKERIPADAVRIICRNHRHILTGDLIAYHRRYLFFLRLARLHQLHLLHVILSTLGNPAVELNCRAQDRVDLLFIIQIPQLPPQIKGHPGIVLRVNNQIPLIPVSADTVFAADTLEPLSNIRDPAKVQKVGAA